MTCRLRYLGVLLQLHLASLIRVECSSLGSLALLRLLLLALGELLLQALELRLILLQAQPDDVIRLLRLGQECQLLSLLLQQALLLLRQLLELQLLCLEPLDLLRCLFTLLLVEPIDLLLLAILLLVLDCEIGECPATAWLLLRILLAFAKLVGALASIGGLRFAPLVAAAAVDVTLIWVRFS